MQLTSNNLDIAGFETQNGSILGLLGNYSLQLNPTDISFEVGRSEQENKQEQDAEGSTLTSRSMTFVNRKVQFKFTIDNTGAVPNPPDGVEISDNGSISASIEKLEKLTVIPVSSTHRPPFVRVSWGLGKIAVFGTVQGFSYKYTYFNALGMPLRAEVSMTVNEVELDGKTQFQSPDITKVSTVKDGDSLVSISEDYYDDKKYYLKLAEVNNLSSFRRLKKGSSIEVPPIKNQNL
jgi:nucleoid-associated protein YgaU